MFGKRNTSQFKSQIEATVRISVDHNTKLTEDQILDEFDKNVSEDFAAVMSSDSRIPTTNFRYRNERHVVRVMECYPQSAYLLTHQ